jgi:polyisoprenoid-binding protein YceI
MLAAFALNACAADRFAIDPNHTYPSLEFPHMGISVWRGKFNKTTGKATLDRAARTGSVEIVVDAASIDFGHDRMNKIALTEDWLDTARFPVMTYRGPMVFEGDAPVAVDGELTLLGVTRPVRLKIVSFKCIAHPVNKREVCGADAEGELDRAEFGMAKYTEGGMGRIRFRIQVEAVREG